MYSYEPFDRPCRRVCSAGCSAALSMSFVAGSVLLVTLVSLNLSGSFHPSSYHSVSKQTHAATTSSTSTSAAAPCTAASQSSTSTDLPSNCTEVLTVFEQVVPPFPESDNVTLPQLAEQVLTLERAGRGRNIIAMSLYGQDHRYTLGAVSNAVLVMRDWPKWTLRVYCGTGVPANITSLLRAAGAEVVLINTNQKGSAGMFWRYFALEDRTVTRVIFRDADAKLTYRDRAAVAEWVASGRFVHAMHDHFYHREFPLMGGMWGAVNGFVNVKILQAWRDQDHHAQQAYEYGADQQWLVKTLWPHAKEYAMQHASMYCSAYGAAEVRPFPTKRASMTDFVGNRYWPDTSFEGMEWKGVDLGQDCPPECRKDQSWTSC